MEDVAGMVEYVRFWGGLPGGVYCKMLRELTQRFVKQERIVSGQFFEWISKLRFPVDERPSMFITAVIFTHVKQDKGVEDGIARFVTKPNVDSLAGKLKADALKGDSILKRCFKLLDQKPKDIKIQMLGDLMEKMVKSVLPQTKADSPQMEAIAAEFVGKFSGTAGLTEACDEQTAGSSSDDKPKVTSVQYDSHGEAVNLGKASLLNKGFQYGSLVSLKKDSDLTKQWKIILIDGPGEVTMAPILPNGLVCDEEGAHVKVDPINFIDRYKEVTKQLVPLKNFPANDVLKTTGFAGLVAKSTATLALVALAAKFPLPSVRGVIEPVKAVYSTAEYAAMELTIVPCTTSISCEAKHQTIDPKSRAMVAEVSYTTKVPTPPFESLMFVFLNPVASDEKMSAVTWLIKTKDDKKKCNCELAEEAVLVKPPSMSTKNTNAPLSVSIQCVRNFRVVKAGDELVLFRPAAPVEQGSKRLMPDIAAASAKSSKK
jgi:hypothetical protein